MYMAGVVVAFGQTRDSIYWSTDTVKVKYDSTSCQTFHLQRDSIYADLDTIQIVVSAPRVTLKGMYTHPNDVTIGSATSENSYLAYCQRQGTNMLNCYARAYFYTDAKRTQLAAFVKKAKEQYGIIEVSVDVRLTDNRELPGIIAYFQKYTGTISMVNLLAEFEPYTLNSSGQYDDKYLPTYAAKYSHFFYIIRTVSPLCKQYHVSFDWYEGWIGNNYNGLSFSQAPVDSMVKYCDRIFLSNYVTVSSYTVDKWGGGMDKRCSTITVGCQHMGIPSRQIVEIVSLEQKIWGAASDFLGAYFVSHSFYGSSYTDGLAAYNTSSTAVLQYTDVVGRTIFYSKYAKLARP